MKKVLKLNILFSISVIVLAVSGCGPVNINESFLNDSNLPPKNILVSAGDSSTDILWDTSENVKYYNLYWSTTSGVDKNSNKIASVTSPYSHTGLTNGITYYYVITSENELEEGDISVEVSATPNAKTPTAPIITASSSNWVKETSAASFSARTDHQVVVFKDKMFLIAGTAGSSPKNDVWSSVDGASWQTEVEKTGLARTTHQAVVFKNKIYLIDGYNIFYGRPRCISDVWNSADGKSWDKEKITGGSFLCRSNHQVVVFKNKMYLIAGIDNDNRNDDVWSSADGKTWTQVIQHAAFSARNAHQVVVFKDKMYLIGGYDDNDMRNDVWSSTDGKNWIEEVHEASFPARYDHQVVVFNDKMYLIGGNTNGNTYKNDIWSSTDGVNWIEDAPHAPFSARWGQQLVVFKNKMYLIGGYSNNGYKNDVWSYAKK